MNSFVLFICGVCVGITAMLLREKIHEERMKRIFAKMVADGKTEQFHRYVEEKADELEKGLGEDDE